MGGIMRAFIVACAAIVAALMPSVCEAQDEEIVVTASRRAQSYQSLVAPTVSLKRRADFAIVSLEITNDTRDYSQRLNEVRDALRGLQALARPGAVTLAIVDEDAGIVRPFSLSAAEDLIRAGRRADTSALTIRLRTPVSEADTLESVQARMSRFVGQAVRPGRTEMELGESQLTMVNVDRYRSPLLEAIAEDGRRAAELFGSGYSIAVSGLQNQVAWLRTGDLELTLFIPYALSISRGSEAQ